MKKYMVETSKVKGKKALALSDELPIKSPFDLVRASFADCILDKTKYIVPRISQIEIGISVNSIGLNKSVHPVATSFCERYDAQAFHFSLLVVNLKYERR
jgi:hypothetical protein